MSTDALAADAQAADAQPADAEAADERAEPAGPEREAEPVEPVQAEPVQAEPVRAEPVRAEPVQAEPVQAELQQAEPVQELQPAEPAQVEEPERAELHPAEPVQAEPVQVQAELRRAEPEAAAVAAAAPPAGAADTACVQSADTAEASWSAHLNEAVQKRDVLMGLFEGLFRRLEMMRDGEQSSRRELDKLRQERGVLQQRLRDADASGAAALAGSEYARELETKLRRLQADREKWGRDQRLHMDLQAEMSDLKKRHRKVEEELERAREELHSFGKARYQALERRLAEVEEGSAMWKRDCERSTAELQQLEVENIRLVKDAVDSKQRVAVLTNEKNELERGLKHVVESAITSPSIPVAAVGDLSTRSFAQQLDQKTALRPPKEIHRRYAQAHGRSEVNSVAVPTVGRGFASAGDDKTVRLWDIGGADEKASFAGVMGAVLRVYFSPTADRVIGLTSDSAVHVWLTGSQCRKVHTLVGHSGKVTGACFVDEKSIITCGADRTLKRWDLSRSGSCVKTTMCWSNCQDIAGAQGGSSVVASAHFDGGLRLWDARTVNHIEELKEAHSQAITSVCFSGCGHKVLTSGRDGYLKMWDTRTHKTCCEVELRDFSSMLATSKACMSPDDSYMAIGIEADGYGDQGIVQIYDTKATPKLRGTLQGHSHSITQVAWTVDGKHIVSSSRDGDVIVWV